MPIDLFQPIYPDAKLHPQFLMTRDDPKFAPARAVLRDVAATMSDPDGNFAEQFQTHGFDARTFEIYLNALFTEAGHSIDRGHDRPDFLITRGGITAAIEAVTANPPPTPDYQPYEPIPTDLPTTKQEIFQYLKNELAIKLGSPLYSKLKKEYWKLPHVAGRPFIIALETFHGPGALGLSSTTLSQYLYGLDHHHRFDADGNLIVEADSIATHVGSKTIPSAFFAQPGAENISAILFSNAGTIPKFGRIGQQGVHRSSAVRMVRYGHCHDHDPNATQPEIFAYEVGDPEVPPEPWRDGSVLIHNPWALHPLPSEWLGAGAEENIGESGTVMSLWRDHFIPYFSMTMMFDGKVADAPMWDQIDIQTTMLSMGNDVAGVWNN